MIIIIFQNIFVWGKCNSRSAVIIFKKIFHNEKSQYVDESNNNLYQEKWAIWSPQMAHPHNSGSTLRVFLKFFRLKGVNKFMKNLFVVFREKTSFGTM